jgi:uncharacterized protein involved in type VI secretion and phage assembly
MGETHGRELVRARLEVGESISVPAGSATIDEALSGHAVATVEVDAIDQIAGVLGCSARVVLWREDDPGTQRRFCGVVRAWERGWGASAWTGGGVRLRIEPAFACLDEERLTRPFVRLSAIEILRQVLTEHLARQEGRELELRLSAERRGTGGAECCPDGFVRRGLCVQYDETTYDFCRRLMAEEGLAHFFDHRGGRERLVLVDGARFDRAEAVIPVATRRPLEARRESIFELSRSLPSALGAAPRFSGAAHVLELAPGRVYALAAESLGAPVWLGDAKLLLTSVRHELCPSHGGARHTSTFSGVPAEAGFRPALLAKPRALEDWGVVVSPNERDPVDADADGRVHVRFFYDRRPEVGATDRSPPIPVSQAWAGDGYGTQILPRAGMLARIEYLQGDPDRPVVAGYFPTGDNLLPAPPPGGKSRLTVRTHGLREEAPDRRWSELALDDAAGAEQLAIRAGRDLVRRVLHDEQATIDHDESRVVGGRQALGVRGSRTKLVDAGERVHVCGSRRIEVGENERRANERRTVSADAGGAGGGDALWIDGRAEITIHGERTIAVERNVQSSSRGGRATLVQGDASSRATATRRTEAGDELQAQQKASSFSLTAKRARLAPDQQLVVMNAGGALVLDAKGEAAFMLPRLRLSCGSSQLAIGDGKITICALKVVVRGAAGAVALDEHGAATTGSGVISSAVIANEIRGLPVIFSDSPGSTRNGGAP